MKKYILLLIAPLLGYAQKTPIEQTTQAITDRFPLTRNFSIQYESNGASDYENELFGENFQKGHLNGSQRLKVTANMPIYKTRNYVISGSVWYKYEHYDVENTINIADQSIRNNYSNDFHYLSTTGSFIYFSSLFRKPVIYTAAVTVDGNQEGPQRVKGLGTAVMILKRTPNTTFALGIAALADKSSLIPFAPLITYDHKFNESPWSISVILPQSILLRRPISNNGLLSLGGELIAENFYVEADSPQLKGTYEYNQLNIRSGITYEHKIGKNLFATLKSGINSPVQARLTERGKKSNKYVLEASQNSTFYLNLGVSYNPF